MLDILIPTPALAEHASQRTSKSYAFVSTKQVMEMLEEKGWALAGAKAARVRNPEREGFQRHMLKFVPADPANEIRVGGSLAQILLLNSHDGSSSVVARGGFYKFACENGLVVGSDVAMSRSAHRGAGADIVASVLAVAERLPELAEIVHAWERVELTELQKLDFATEALKTRWPHHAPITPTEALRVRREVDQGDTLWQVFNRVQENVIKAGMMGVNTAGQVRAVRAIESLGAGVDVNVALWNLAQSVAA